MATKSSSGFWYPTHWTDIALAVRADLSVDDAGGVMVGRQGLLGEDAVALLETRDRYLEDFINSLGSTGVGSFVYQTSQQAIATTTQTILIYDTVDYDDLNCFDGSTKFVAPSSGFYFVNAAVKYVPNATGTRALFIFKDAAAGGTTTLANITVGTNSTVGDATALTVNTGGIKLLQGDAVYGVVYQTSGGVLDTDVTGFHLPNLSIFNLRS